jgi:hypothetical protein
MPGDFVVKLTRSYVSGHSCEAVLVVLRIRMTCGPEDTEHLLLIATSLPSLPLRVKFCAKAGFTKACSIPESQHRDHCALKAVR